MHDKSITRTKAGTDKAFRVQTDAQNPEACDSVYYDWKSQEARRKRNQAKRRASIINPSENAKHEAIEYFSMNLKNLITLSNELVLALHEEYAQLIDMTEGLKELCYKFRSACSFTSYAIDELDVLGLWEEPDEDRQ